MKAALIGLGVTAGVGAALALRARRTPTAGWTRGAFPDGMGFVRFGAGARSLLWIPDPSHSEPTAGYLRFMARTVTPFVQAGHTVHLVGLGPHLPPDATVSDFADGYAQLIEQEFDGRVDLLVADSQGGVIGFALAARRPHLFGSFAAVAASHALEPTAREASRAAARLLSEGRRAEAVTVMVALQNPWLKAPWLLDQDVLLIAQAVNDPGIADLLPTITVPVLLVCGDRDNFVSEALYEETARLIPDATLTVYRGKGHLGTLADPRLAPDILGFAARHAEVSPPSTARRVPGG